MSRRGREMKGRIAGWLATRASRNTGAIDRVCRRLLDRILALPEEENFMRDEWIDSDAGFDPDELERYQRGES